jgi:2-oxoglutarate dehydrogenase E2 component (dihydrolipoamide succinyltransferase)
MISTIEVRAPTEQSEGTRLQVQRWLKSVGDAIAENEPLIEVETDKVTIEIPSPANGVLHEILKQEQDEISPGELLGRIQAEAGAQPVNIGSEAEQPLAAAKPRSATNDADIASAALALHADALAMGRSSPAVRRLLAEHGLQASSIRGTGTASRITVDDVLAHVSSSKSIETEVTDAGAAARRVPHSAIRRRIAQRMVHSLLHTAPHVTTIFEADLGAVQAHRSAHRADFERRGGSLTLTSYFIAACSDAIRAVPEANSRWTEDALIISESIDIGIATAIEAKGLLVPVIRNVQSLDLFAICRELGDLVRRAREEQLSPKDLRGGTFTISNHGVSGSLVATPIIINQPQSAILGVGKLEKRAVVVSENDADRIVIRPRCYVTLTIDHRVMDGHRANRFLQVLVERLENWSD